MSDDPVAVIIFGLSLLKVQKDIEKSSDLDAAVSRFVDVRKAPVGSPEKLSHAFVADKRTDAPRSQRILFAARGR